MKRNTTIAVFSVATALFVMGCGAEADLDESDSSGETEETETSESAITQGGCMTWHNCKACWSTDKFWFRACDYDVDGNKARAWFHPTLNAPESYRVTPWAPSQGCGEWAGSWTMADRVRVCVENEGCSGWHYF